jgi:GNAT superfamily N-acetyltransferase
VLVTLEAYYDAVPRSAARAEQHGPFTLFVADGAGWPFYARPRLGLEADVDPGDVTRMRERQRELGVPEALEWVHETTPSLLAAARAAGLTVLRAPLMVLDRGAWRAQPPPRDVRVRLLEPGDADVAAAIAVAQVAFAAEGTAVGPAGPDERDRAAAAVPAAEVAQRRARLREGLTVTAVAAGAAGPLSAGSHQPVGDVTELVGIGTLPSARRRGLGAAVTSRLVADAGERELPTIFLAAGSPSIARVYERVGFRRIGTACIAEPVRASAGS